jgi:hypothetical protein
VIHNPILKPLAIPLDQPHQVAAALPKERIQLLVLLVRFVDSLVHIVVGQLSGLPELELFI